MNPHATATSRTRISPEADIGSYLALNCAFITWKTNRVIGRKDPLEYLKDRVQWAGEESVRERMKSHLIDFDLLAKANYRGLVGDHPPYNRLDLQFSECLRQAVHDASESDIRVLVVQAEGPHFSFGSDLREWR